MPHHLSAGPDVAALATVAQYLVQLSRATSVRDVADVTVRHLCEATGAMSAELVVATPAQLSVLATTDREQTAALLACRREAGEPPPPSAAMANQTVVVEDLALGEYWPDFSELAIRRTPVRAAVLPYTAVPGLGHVVLAVADERPHYFTRARHRYVQLVSLLAARALSQGAGHP